MSPTTAPASPDEIAATLFQPRQQRSGPTAGAGLGLSIAKGIVDAHGGRIELERLARGSRFAVRLPTEQVDSSHRHPEEHELHDG